MVSAFARSEPAIIAVTRRGSEMACRLASGWNGTVELFLPQKWAVNVKSTYSSAALRDKNQKTRINTYAGSVNDIIASQFSSRRSLILVMAAGIAVRSIGPLLRSKASDPGVVVLDEAGRFAISLAGGHLGGANELAREIARISGANPIITTASDSQGKVSLDIWAQACGLYAEPAAALTIASAAWVNGLRTAIFTPTAEAEALMRSVAPEGRLPDFFPLGDYPAKRDSLDAAILVTSEDYCSLPLGHIIFYPPALLAGIGCRRGIDKERIIEAVNFSLLEVNRSRYSLKGICTIDLKADETGLQKAAAALGVPIIFVSRQELAHVLEANLELTRSQQVLERMGVGGVCEPAILAQHPKAKLILRKKTFPGVTVALGEVPWP